ncbi:MAG TPA: response regulator [Gemmatimonadales bacterium]|jgi:PAS domain S-box-containing protein|nr:response regulator [Gemmatimonadales bacterium]
MSGLPRGPTRVLVIEDSATQAEALRALLAGAGYEVTLAASGEEGLARFAADEFAVVITDIVMPGALDGYEVCRRIKAGPRRDTPVILLTSLSDPLDIIRGLECGADNFFTKAVEPAHLLERLRLLLTTRETRAQAKLRMGVKVFFMDREFTITAEREQILDLLISTFEDAVRQNRALRQREAELRAAQTQLARYAGALERRLQSVLDNVPDVVFSMSADAAHIYYASPACTRVLGLSPEELVTDPSPFRAAIHPDDEARVIASCTRAVETGRPATLEFRIRRPDGALRWIEGRLIPVAEAEAAGVRLDGVVRDVTEQRRLADQLRQAQKMEAVGRLAGGVAHDFNNLLTVITSYADLLLEELALADPRRAEVEEIRKAAASAAALTRQLLAFSRQQVLEPRVLDVNAVVSAAQKLLKRLLGEDITLVTVLAPELGTVRADPGQLEQLIVNLAVNARDAMPEGGKLTIETANADMDEAYVRDHPLARPGRYVMLAISDTGVGMDEATQRRIFEPFFTTKEAGKGTGLGLATVYGIVKQSGGFIWVYSEPGHGATFKIYLPRVDEPVEGAPTSAEPRELPRGTETVLLVEDAAAVRAVTRQILERLGYTVLEAPNGEVALHVATKHQGPLHLLLTDVVMPELGGRHLAEQLTALRPELRILYASGYTDDAVVRHGVLRPGTAYLQKPFTPELLARKVREVLDAPRGPAESSGRAE